MNPNSIHYHSILADYFSGKPLYLDEPTQMKPGTRKLVELSFQQTKAEMWDEVTDTLCDLEFIQAKAVAKMTYDLVNDFNAVLQEIPYNAENILEENERQARMYKYTRDLIAYAKGEIKVLEMPETVPLWSEEKTNAEIERMKTNPIELDRLRDFINFLGQEAGNLQNYAHEFPHFVTQQAWNYANSGPVSNAAEKGNTAIHKSLLLRDQSIRPPWNPLPQVLYILKGHTNYIEVVSITPDGKKAISGSVDQTCILWDLTTGKALQILRGHTSSVNAVSITPDGQRAISGSNDNTCIFWDLETGQVLQTLRGHTNSVNAVSITANGERAISGSTDNTCIFWDLETGQVLQTLRGHTSGVDAVSITANGERAISGSDNTCILWDLGTGKALQTLRGHTLFVKSVSVTLDGHYAISGSWDKTCIVWDLTHGREKQIFKAHNSWISMVSITPDGNKAISGSYDNTCILWDLVTGRQVHTLKEHPVPVTAISITPDGKKAFSGGANTCFLWDLSTGRVLKTLKKWAGCYTVSIAPDGKKAITGGSATCILWDISTGQVLQTFKGYEDQVMAVSITPDGKRAISCVGRTFVLWDLYTGQTLHTFKGHNFNVNAVFISPDGKKAISGSEDNNCIVWDLLTGQSLHLLKGHTDRIDAVSISPDGKRAISGSWDKTCILWDLESGNRLAYFTTDSGISVVSIFPNGIILGGESGEVVILKTDKNFLCHGRAITTIRQIWDFELLEFLPLSADCPVCGHRFLPPTSVLATIDYITKKSGLRPEQSPCLELPDEAWEELGLLENCPKCGGKLKFNPFIVGEYKPKSKWKFWQ